MTWRKRARLPRHPVNAMLNYGYGMLAHQLRSQVVAAGLDPTIGIVHGNSENSMPLVYELMEPLRPLVDAEVLTFASGHTFCTGGLHDREVRSVFLECAIGTRGCRTDAGGPDRTGWEYREGVR